jgi:multiple sugar transport system substrate-binding protein
MWRKKAISIGLIAIMSVMAACGSTGDNKPAESAGGNATAPAKTNPPGETDKQVTITVWDKSPDDDVFKPVLDEIFAEFDATHPHIKVNHVASPPGTSVNEVFMTANAGGEGPDAFHNTSFPDIRDWVKAGVVQDLSSYWNDYADKEQYLPSAMEQATIDGKVYGVPADMYLMGLMYRKDLFREAGLDPDSPPRDWEEFAEVAQKLTNPDKKQYGYALLGMDWADWFFEYYVWQAGGDLTTKNEDGTIALDFTKEPTVTALQYWHDLKWKYKVVQSNVAQNFDDNKQDFFQKRAAMMLGASDWFGDFAANGVSLDDVGFSSLPAGPSGQAPSQVGGRYWIINPKSEKEKQDAAWEYIVYINSKEVRDKLNTFRLDNGIMPNLLSTRKDVNPLEFTSNVPQDLVANVQKAAEVTQLEYALKSRLSPYIVPAIQKVLLNENADIAAELKDAEDKAQREVVGPYNAEIGK